jgi:hypothetical protein
MMEMSVCRIYVPNDHKVILSRDVQFQERIDDCISKGKLPMKNIENEDQVEEKEDRPDEQKTDTEGNSEINSEGSQKLRKVSRGDEKYKTRNELGDIDEEEETSQQTSGRVLRDRSMIVEEFVNQVTEDPATFEDAWRSENSAEWKKAMDREITSLKENQDWSPRDSVSVTAVITAKLSVQWQRWAQFVQFSASQQVRRCI